MAQPSRQSPITRAARVRARAKFLTYRGLGVAMAHIPEPLVHGVARAVARAIARGEGPAQRVNERHLARVLASECFQGVEPDRALVRRWSRRSFDAYARYWVDGARLPYENEGAVHARFVLQEGREHLDAALAAGRGMVMALPHVGSWEWGGYWLALEGTPMTAVVERVEPEELFEWFVGQRASMGMTAVPLGPGSGAALVRALKANQIAGLVSDRDLVGSGVEVEFFGELTTLPSGPATLALRTGAPLLPVVVYSGPGPFRTGIIHPPLDTARRGSLREDLVRVTQDLAATFEHDIRCRPEQWHLFQPNWPSDRVP